MLALDDITVAFDGFTVLDELSFRVDQGELRFLIGPNGAGKTTLLDLLTGKVRPLTGKVMYDGNVDVSRHSEHSLVKLGIGRKFQTPAIYRSLTCWEHLEVAIGFRRGILGLFGSLSRDERADRFWRSRAAQVGSCWASPRTLTASSRSSPISAA